MRLLPYLTLILAIGSILVSAHKQTLGEIGNTLALNVRQRRASSTPTSNLSYTGCGHWSDWISRNTPSSLSTKESEHFTDADLDKLCPTAGGNQVKDFRCRDEKGEAIHGIFNKTDVSNVYIYTCDNMSATCNVIATSVPGARCPDYAIRIKCECPPTTTTESTTSIRTATSRYSTVAPSPTILGGTAVVNVTTGNKGTIVNVASTAASPTILGGTAVSNVTTGNIGTTVNVASTASAIDGGSTTNAGGMIKTTSGRWSGYDHGTGTVGYVSISGVGFHGNGSTLGNGTVHGLTSVDISSQTTSSSILNWLIPVIAGISFLAAFLILLLCIYKKKRKQVSDAQVDNM